MTSRRYFLGAAAIATAASPILGANDRIRVGLIGCGGRGRYVANFIRQAPDVEFVACADVFLPNAERAREWAGPNATAYQDFRKLLERKDVDAVQVATPDHWHAAATVLACQAGKDVYVEKPIAHNIREGRKMVDAARRYDRIVQAGMQQRSAPHYQEVQRLVQSGAIGKVHLVRVWNYVNMAPHGIGTAPDSAPPEGLDWDFYLGPAPQVPFNPKRFLSTFRWFRDYAGGYITDYGTHRFDTVHQIMGATAPKTVVATGRRFHLDDPGNIPDIMQVTYEYSDFVLTYEACLLNGMGTGPHLPGMKYYNARGEDDRPHGEAYYGTNGTIFCDRIGYEVYAETKPEGKAPERAHKQTTDATSLHAMKFIENVRAHRRPDADIEIGHRSTTVPLLGNVSYDTGHKLHWDAVKEECTADPEANRLLARLNPRAKWTWI